MQELVQDNNLGLDLQDQVSKPQLQKPRMYRVVLLNDDYTPMDFVVGVLKQFFGMSETRALQVMLQVHRDGKGNCGVFTRDVAETKVYQVNIFAQVNEHPLLAQMEVA